MTLGKLAAASPALKKLAVLDLPVKTAYKVALLIDKLNPHLEFFGAQEIKIYAENRALEELTVLRETEADGLEFEKIEIPLSLEIKLSAADIKMLEPFINFIEE